MLSYLKQLILEKLNIWIDLGYISHYGSNAGKALEVYSIEPDTTHKAYRITYKAEKQIGSCTVCWIPRQLLIDILEESSYWEQEQEILWNQLEDSFPEFIEKSKK